MVKFLLFCILLVLYWPVALAALLLYRWFGCCCCRSGWWESPWAARSNWCGRW